MGNLINPADRDQIEAQAAHGSTAAIRRRAQLLLLYDQGLPTREVAEQIGLSESRTRFWRRRFIFEGMQIFAESSLNNDQLTPAQPDEESSAIQLLPAAIVQEDESTVEDLPEMVEEVGGSISEDPLESIQESESEPISLDELRQRYPTNLRRAEHRRDLALELFDATQATHQLPDEQRRLLEVAALLQYLTENEEDEKANKSGYLFILSHPLTDLSEVDNKIVEDILGSLHGKVAYPPNRDPDQLLSPAEHEALTLAALLRIASGLDASQTQGTNIDRIELDSERLLILVNGPQAKVDARRAKKAAKLWTTLFKQKVRLQVVYQLEQEGDERLETLIAKRSPGVEPDDTLSEAGRKVLGYHYAQMVLHEAGTRLGEDIEELHDMRVATRRMRAAFEVFRDAFEPKAVKPHLKGLRATGRALGRVRDLDVFMEKAQQYLDTIPQEQRSGLEPLLILWENERQDDREKMMEHLNGEDYANFKRKFLKFVSTPGAGAKPVSETSPHIVKHILPALSYTHLAAVRAYGPILDSATIEQLHSLRIEFKKLRYTLEFFREVLGEEAKELIKEIKNLQDHLGDLNDADVACSILRQFLDEWESRQVYRPISERENPEPVVAYLASKHAERYFLTTSFQNAWQRFDQPEMRAKLASAIADL
jgi:CHAD domain-containing protein/transposase